MALRRSGFLSSRRARTSAIPRSSASSSIFAVRNCTRTVAAFKMYRRVLTDLVLKPRLQGFVLGWQASYKAMRIPLAAKTHDHRSKGNPLRGVIALD